MTDSLLVRLNNSLLAAGNMTHTEFCHRTGIQWKKMQDFREGLPTTKHIRNKIARGINDLKPLIEPETAPNEVPAPAVQTTIEDVPEEPLDDDMEVDLKKFRYEPFDLTQIPTIKHATLSITGTKPSLSESDRRILTHLIFSGNISLEDKNRYVDFIYNQSV